MDAEPVVVASHELEWQAWPAEEAAVRGQTEWKTLISAGLTHSQGLTMGVARLRPGGALHAHRHEQVEAYLILAGTGVVTIDGTPQAVGPDVAVFIPGNALHSIEATRDAELRFAYVFAADAFEDVKYVFGE